MLAGRTTRSAMRFVSTVAYAAILFPATLVVLWAVRFAEYYVGLPGPLAVAAPMLLVGGTVFGFWSWALLRLERTEKPTILDHLRRSVFLYLLCLFLSYLLVKLVDLRDPGAGAVMLCVFAGFAMLVDALVLLVVRHRFDHTELGAAA